MINLNKSRLSPVGGRHGSQSSHSPLRPRVNVFQPSMDASRRDRNCNPWDMHVIAAFDLHCQSRNSKISPALEEVVHQSSAALANAIARLTSSSKAFVVVRLLVLRDYVRKRMVVILLQVTPRRLIRAEALVVFAVRSGALETVPEMAV